MDIETARQIVETIKTLNINFNDATTQKIADALTPLVQIYFLKEILVNFIWAAFVGGGVALGIYACHRLSKWLSE